MMMEKRVGSSPVQCIEPTEEGNERGVPVDGYLVGGVGLMVVDIGFVWEVGWVGGMVHVTLVLLSRVGTSYEHAGEGSLDGVGLRDAVMGMQWALVAKACDIAVACGVASQQVVGVLKGMRAVGRRAVQLIGIEQHEGLTAAVLCETAPSELTGMVAEGGLEGGEGHVLHGIVAIGAELGAHGSAHRQRT